MDRDTGRSKGFGFVEMKTDQEAQAAIARPQRQGPRRPRPDRQRSTAQDRRRRGRRPRWLRRRWRRRWRPALLRLAYWILWHGSPERCGKDGSGEPSHNMDITNALSSKIVIPARIGAGGDFLFRPSRAFSITLSVRRVAAPTRLLPTSAASSPNQEIASSW